MSDAKRRRLENTIASVQRQHGPQALRRGNEFAYEPAIPHVSTSFAALDAITGCGGVPLGAITLFSGRTTSGKLTIAYKALANAQRDPYGRVAYAVGLIDLSRTADPDYVARCGIDLDALLVARPQPGKAMAMLGDMLQTHRLRAVVVDGVAELAADPGLMRQVNGTLGKLQQLVRASGAALIFLDDPHPPWMRWFNLDSSNLIRWCATIHVEMQRERWLREGAQMVGYQAQARLLKSRWVYGIRSAKIKIEFNGTVHAQETW
jgi:recombination protein RecA